MQMSLSIGALSLASGVAAAGSLAAVTEPTAALAPYVGGGAGVLAVGALVEVTRRLLNGRLIPRESKELEDDLADAVTAAGQREDRAMRLVEDVRDEMRALRRVIEERR